MTGEASPESVPAGMVRWGSLATIAGGVVWLAAIAATDAATFDHLRALAVALGAIGILGFHALQRTAYGWGGRLGVHLVLGSSAALVVATATGWEALRATAVPALMLGYLVYGVVAYLARVLPRWSGPLLALALPIGLARPAWIAAGAALWRRRGLDPASIAGRRVFATERRRSGRHVSARVFAVAALLSAAQDSALGGLAGGPHIAEAVLSGVVRGVVVGAIAAVLVALIVRLTRPARASAPG